MGEKGTEGKGDGGPKAADNNAIVKAQFFLRSKRGRTVTSYLDMLQPQCIFTGVLLLVLHEREFGKVIDRTAN